MHIIIFGYKVIKKNNGRNYLNVSFVKYTPKGNQKQQNRNCCRSQNSEKNLTSKESSNQQNPRLCRFGLIESVHGRYSGKYKLPSTPSPNTGFIRTG